VSTLATLSIVCAWCERVRTGGSRWERTDVPPVAGRVTHGICPECLTDQKREAAHTPECQ
jgi:hypothetical protein